MHKNIKPNCTNKTWMMKDPKGSPFQSWSLSLNIESQQHFDGCKQLMKLVWDFGLHVIAKAIASSYFPTLEKVPWLGKWNFYEFVMVKRGGLRYVDQHPHQCFHLYKLGFLVVKFNFANVIYLNLETLIWSLGGIYRIN